MDNKQTIDLLFRCDTSQVAKGTAVAKEAAAAFGEFAVAAKSGASGATGAFANYADMTTAQAKKTSDAIIREATRAAQQATTAWASAKASVGQTDLSLQKAEHSATASYEAIVNGSARTGWAFKEVGKGASNSGYRIMQLGQTLDDLQYVGEMGLRPIINNVMQLSAGLGIAMIAGNLLYQNWDKLTGLFGNGRVLSESEAMEELGKKTSKTAEETERLNAAKERQSQRDAVTRGKTEDVQASEKALQELQIKKGRNENGSLAERLAAQRDAAGELTDNEQAQRDDSRGSAERTENVGHAQRFRRVKSFMGGETDEQYETRRERELHEQMVNRAADDLNNPHKSAAMAAELKAKGFDKEIIKGYEGSTPEAIAAKKDKDAGRRMDDQNKAHANRLAKDEADAETKRMADAKIENDKRLHAVNAEMGVNPQKDADDLAAGMARAREVQDFNKKTAEAVARSRAERTKGEMSEQERKQTNAVALRDRTAQAFGQHLSQATGSPNPIAQMMMNARQNGLPQQFKTSGQYRKFAKMGWDEKQEYLAKGNDKVDAQLKKQVAKQLLFSGATRDKAKADEMAGKMVNEQRKSLNSQTGDPATDKLVEYQEKTIEALDLLRQQMKDGVKVKVGA